MGQMARAQLRRRPACSCSSRPCAAWNVTIGRPRSDAATADLEDVHCFACTFFAMMACSISLQFQLSISHSLRPHHRQRRHTSRQTSIGDVIGMGLGGSRTLWIGISELHGLGGAGLSEHWLGLVAVCFAVAAGHAGSGLLGGSLGLGPPAVIICCWLEPPHTSSSPPFPKHLCGTNLLLA